MSSFNIIDKDVNSTGLELVNETVPGLLTKQAHLTPEALALDSYEGQWTYSQLEDDVVRLQAYLEDRGVEAGARIGILLPLSAKGVICMMATMRLGAAVVPVDIHHPPPRQATMFKEADVRIIISEDPKQRQFGGEFRVLALTEFEMNGPRSQTNGTHGNSNMHSSGHEGGEHVTTWAKSGDDAYIAFTSGSTGKPKGIVQSHAAIVTMSRALALALDVQPRSRVAQIAPYVFDVAMMEFAMSFGTGAALCTMRRKELIYPEPGELAENLTKARITHVTMSPTMLRSVVPRSIPSVTMLTVMGEALDRGAVETWSSTNERQFRQLWGCTEGVILQSITPPIRAHHEPQNVGAALEGACRLWIVDPQDSGFLQEDGQSGELVVESRALASRYINQPEQTARAFLSGVPWTTSSADAKFYLTGDLARKETDGSVTFLGRQDGQMSLHGERIELGEIDYHLGQLQLPQDADCFAEFDAVSQTIIGVVCDNKSADLLTDDALKPKPWRDSVVSSQLLQQCMQQLLDEGKLAPNMVPRHWVPLPRRPLTISHKTDRAKLRQMFAALSPEDWDYYRVIAEDAEDS